jgi:NitT/TauT family transport system substrate-binding protein
MKQVTKLVVIGIVIALIVIAGITAYLITKPSGQGGNSSTITSSSTTSSSCCSASVVRIGYFANINHGQALVGLFNGDFRKALGGSVQIQATLFTAGPTEMTALLAGKLDMAYVGPSPAVNAFIQSNGTGLKIIAGASSGGALFVVTDASGIRNATAGGITAQLEHKAFLAPQLGNTQDVALRSYLLKYGLVAGANVTVQDTSNANIVTQLVENKSDGAWVPQPYASLILSKAKTHVFLDERSLWPGGSFSTAELVVSTSFLTAHPDVVERIVGAHVNETLWINAHLAQASTLMNDTIATQTGLGISPSAMSGSLATLSFTYDPLETSVQQQALNAYQLGFLGKTPPNLNGLFDLTILNQALNQLGLTAVTS